LSSHRLQSVFPSNSLVILIILWALRLSISPTAPSSSHYKNICDLLDKARVSNTEGLLLMLVFSLDLNQETILGCQANCQGRIPKYCHNSLKNSLDPILASKTECQLCSRNHLLWQSNHYLLSHNLVLYIESKHTELDILFVWEKFLNLSLLVTDVPMCANLLIFLPRFSFCYLITKLFVCLCANL